jgi:hypothetical protein
MSKIKKFDPETETQHFMGELSAKDLDMVTKHFAKKHAAKAKTKATKANGSANIIKKIFG